jgi:hypothetical protein
MPSWNGTGEMVQFETMPDSSKKRGAGANDEDVEDWPLEYPSTVHRAGIAIITRFDLTAVVESVRAAESRNLQAVRPNMDFFRLSVKTGEGMAGTLERWRTFSRTAVAVSK